MAEIERCSKPLAINPLKAGAPLGASLATLGFHRAMPVLHGSQGCTAFGKVYLVRHFNEPIPLQTTAMDPVSTVMGADANAHEALETVCSKSAPALVTLLTTGLSEAQGTDIHRLVREFREAHPEHAGTAVVAVNTPDFAGGLESGYAAALRAIVDALVPAAASAGTAPGRDPARVNVLLSAAHGPGDAEAIAELVEAFGLEPVLIPDLSTALDGHLADADHSPVTTGGRPVADLAGCGDAAATLVVGASLNAAADRLAERTGVPDYRFDHLVGLAATDRLVMALREISGRDAVPARVERHRRQLQDALLDAHTVLGAARVAVAAEADRLAGLAALLGGVGAEVAAAVAPERAPVLERLPLPRVVIGDLEALEGYGRAAGADLVLGSSHAAATAERLGVPLVEHGYPSWERLGRHLQPRVGYRGSRDALFELANTLLEHHERHGGLTPYRSVYRPTAA